jgi:methylglutaconyl-CoA hydratase
MNYIMYEKGNRIAKITLNRPDKRNALNGDVVSELTSTLHQAAADNDVKIIILAARGDAFCAGADLGYLQQLQKFSYEENLADSTKLKELLFAMYTLPKVIIAQVQGHALAGGCGLVSVCDFALSVHSARFGYTEVKIGFVPAIVMPFLVRKIGEGKARKLLLSGNPITAAEALELGLITGLTEPEKLENETLQLARQLVITNSGQSMALTKKLLYQTGTIALEAALEHAARANAEARSTADCQRGITAFLNKEKVLW